MGQTDTKAAWIESALEAYERPLMRFARVLAGPEHAADVVQDTFVRLCAKEPHELEGRLAPWLFTVCRNRAMDIRRQRFRTKESSDVDEVRSEEQGPSSSLERKQAAERVLAAMGDLSDRDREVITLRFSAELSYREIAEATALTSTNVGVIIHNALSKLRTTLEIDERLVLKRRLAR